MTLTDKCWQPLGHFVEIFIVYKSHNKISPHLIIHSDILGKAVS